MTSGPSLRRGARRTLVLAVACASLLAPLASSHASSFDNRPKILLHVKGTTTKSACTYGSAGITNCSGSGQITTAATLTPVGGPGYYYVYVLAHRGSLSSVAGIQFGITYQNGNPSDITDLAKVDIFGWTLCATLEFQMPSPVWPRPGSGNLITWDSTNNCQLGEVAVAGYFYAACYGASDILRVIPRPVDNAAKIANCQNTETTLFAADLGYISFSSGASVPGCNPCQQNCGSGSSDTTPPAAVQDLVVTSVTTSSVSIRWTAPGDDGNTGVANNYDVRYSLSPITQQNFGTAFPVSGEPAPGPPGTIQSMAVGGLAQETTYYFALRTADESFNYSNISNVVSGTTLPTWQVRVTPDLGACAPLPMTCTTIPFRVEHSGTRPVRAYSISFRVNSPYAICAPGIVEDSYLSDVGTTFFQSIDGGSGNYTVDATLLGPPCGSLAADGSLFSINIQRPGTSGGQPITVTSVLVRDCDNLDIPSEIGSYSIDISPPAAIVDLAGVQVKTGNGPGGTTGITVTFSTAPDVDQVHVYRAPFGGYPGYDDAGGAVPALQNYPPGPPWTLTSVAHSGDVDHPPTRDFWYYMAFAQDSCMNVSGPSNLNIGALNYHLGDVSDGVTLCQGDNSVDLADVSALGAHYGATLAVNDPLTCLDVGPTVNGTVNGRPLTDHKLQFEDLVLYGLNYSVVSAPRPPLRIAGADPGTDALSLAVAGDGPLSAERRVTIVLEGSGRIQGLSVALAWDPALATPVDFEAGDLAFAQGTPAMVLSGSPGTIDAVVMGAGYGFAGSGGVATVTFRVAPGTMPEFGVKSVTARDLSNQDVDVTVELAKPFEPVPTGIVSVSPNPFAFRTDVVLATHQASPVRVDVVDVRGRLVRRLSDGVLPLGVTTFTWDGRNDSGGTEPSGFYVVRAAFPDHVESRSIRLVR